MSSEDEDNDTVESEAADAADVDAAAAAVREEPAETGSSEARRKLRDQMQADIEAFLKAGGRIEQVEPSASAQSTPLTATAGNEAG
jgi:hypothetical protein